MGNNVDWDALKQKTLLVVDDSLPLKELNASLLEELGFQDVKMAASGMEALNLYENHPIDFTLLDIDMPEMDGIETLKKIKAAFPNTYIVMLSGHAEPDKIKESINNGANGFIVKPCGVDKLEEVVSKFARQFGITC